MLAFRDIESCVRDVTSSYDIDRVYLFGSYARGSAGDDSDIDLCLETGPTFSLFSAGGFQQDLSGLLQRPVDVVTERALYDFVSSSYLRDRVLLYER